jgi:hypothetical protein
MGANLVHTQCTGGVLFGLFSGESQANQIAAGDRRRARSDGAAASGFLGDHLSAFSADRDSIPAPNQRHLQGISEFAWQRGP